jgi:LysM repeat protein
MKNYKILGIVGIFFILIALFIGVAMGAEYTVKNGDNLTKISKLTGHTIKQLIQMNKIENPNFILIGQKITFISKEDIKDALLWCKKRTKELNPLDSNYGFFMNAIRHLDLNHISYSVDEEPGLYFDLVLCFAKAWQTIKVRQGVANCSLNNIMS